MVMDKRFWSGKKVFVTGHTGFKGAWLSLWLQTLGAEVTGYALEPGTNPNLFSLANVASGMKSIIGDIRDLTYLRNSLVEASPEIVFHLAAQPIVLRSYEDPIETFSTNVMGTVNLLDSVRTCSSIQSLVNVTTDKCYENKEWTWAYRESDALGGHDPYSCSKSCSELVTESYRRSFFHADGQRGNRVMIATARAGNVIGGGDWADNRLLPDIIRAMEKQEPIRVRHPQAVRPWQHVLEPLYGYMMLASKMYESGSEYAEGWNFGPMNSDVRSVKWIVNKAIELWGEKVPVEYAETSGQPHEANSLMLDISKACQKLKWEPVWSIDRAISEVVLWHKAYLNGDNVRDICVKTMNRYQNELSL